MDGEDSPKIELTEEQLWRGTRRTGMDRRQFLSWAGTASLGAVLAACSFGGGGTSGSASPAPSGGFKILSFFTTEDDPNTIKAVNDAVAAFEGKNPGVKINQILISPDERDSRVLTGLSVGQDLGIFEVGASYRGAIADAGYLYPLDSFIKDIGVDQFAAGTRLVSNGHDWVFPYGYGPPVLWARKDRVPQIPTTFDAFKAAAAANTGGGKYGMALAAGTGLPFDYEFPMFVYQHGGDYFDVQGNVVFGSSQVTQAITDYVAILAYSPPNKAAFTYGDYITGYTSGRVAMTHYAGRLGGVLENTNQQLASISQVTLPPYGPTIMGGSPYVFMGIDKKTANPDIAIAFMKFLYIDGGAAYSNTVPGQLISAVKSVRDAALAANTPFIQKHQDWVKVMSTAQGPWPTGPMGTMATGTYKPYDGPPAPWVNAAFGINPIDEQMMQKIVLGGMSIADGQAWAVGQYKSVVSDYKRKNPGWKPFSG